MQYREALEVITNKAPSKYRGTQLQLLTMLVRGCSDKNPLYRDKDIDSPDIRSRHRLVSNLCSRLGIGADQLRNVIKKVSEVELVKWSGGRVTLRLRNLEALNELPDYIDTSREKIEQRRKYKTEIARKARAEKRASTVTLSRHVSGEMCNMLLGKPRRGIPETVEWLKTRQGVAGHVSAKPFFPPSFTETVAPPSYEVGGNNE